MVGLLKFLWYWVGKTTHTINSALFRILKTGEEMSEETVYLLEEDIPWEVKLIQEYCKSRADLESVSEVAGS